MDTRMADRMDTATIIVLEDEPLIAMDMEFTLHEGGYTDIVLLTSCAAAFEYLSHDTPSLAIVDLHLKDGTCNSVCQELSLRNVPVLVSTASEKHEVDQKITDLVWLSKPCAPSDLLDAVKDALSEDSMGERHDGTDKTEKGARNFAAR